MSDGLAARGHVALGGRLEIADSNDEGCEVPDLDNALLQNT
jgi:hypothetical protein